MENPPVTTEGTIVSLKPQSLLLEPDQNVHKLKKSFVCVCHNNIEFGEAVGLQEPEQSVIHIKAPLDQSPLDSSQPHEAGILSTILDDNCRLLSGSVAEGKSDQVVQNHVGRTLNMMLGCVKTDFKSLEPISNGDVFIPPEDPCPNINLDSTSTTPDPRNLSDPGSRLLDPPRIVKYKHSSITFSHYTCPSAADNHGFVNETSEDGESSLEEDDHNDDDGDDGDGDDGDDGDDDDVFSDLPQSREYLVQQRQRSTGKDKPKRRSTASARAEINQTASKSGYEAEGDTCCMEESAQVKSPWSESMSQLMRKLDQLNLDIEEALSANSSPSDTPCTTRKKQWGAVSKSTLNQALNDQLLQRPDRGECPSDCRSSAPRSALIETRASIKKTMFNKMTNAAGAGKK
ncbi:hypothetical protein CgunFtcFv8_010836 [Champsocephalus gunnari]|uniref:Uncharacterized protein n=1 Tax=Champsocephalus gunnari TaxID=52237 RepID=A0AAN8HVT9_CHAGU|nr:hypothetical protein CgunFtcFv8_010836 [Champsocephalus gunnari]